MKPRPHWAKVAAAIAIAVSFIAAIPLSGYLQNQGTFAPLGQTDIAMPDSNYTLLAADYSSRALRFTGALTADRNATVPLEKGITYEITNATTGGFNILFGGSSGARATIPASSTAPLVVHSPDGVGFYLMSGAGGGTSGFNCIGGDLDGGCADGGPIYVVGLANQPLSVSFRAPSTNSAPYYDGVKWALAQLSTTGDVTCTFAANVGTCTVVSATGTGTNEGDGGGTKLSISATEECLNSGSANPYCAYATPVLTFTDSTTWQTIWQRQQAVNQPDHVYIEFTADDFSADGGSTTKNFAKCQIGVHASTDTVQTLLTPEGANDVGPGPISLPNYGNSHLGGCTTNTTDAGCVPDNTCPFTFRAQMSGSYPAVLQVQAQATSTTRWSWKSHIKLDEQRSGP